MALNIEQLLRAFLDLGDVADFHCIDCRTLQRKPQSIIEKFPLQISSVSQKS
jgi:hypothetical protein